MKILLILVFIVVIVAAISTFAVIVSIDAETKKK